MIKTFLKYCRTIRYLNFFHSIYRIFFGLYKPDIQAISSLSINASHTKGIKPIPKNKSINSPSNFLFLNQTKELKFPEDWHADLEMLWLYNLHYFDGINSEDKSLGVKESEELILSWIENNSLKSLGWDSYPTSLRIVNWIKWIRKFNINNKEITNNLALQAMWLSKRIEYHLSANHILANAKALIFAGLFFESKESQKWLKQGYRIYRKEIIKQVLADGGHYERSPMYHSIILEDILDLINASYIWPDKLEKDFISDLKNISIKMLNWLSLMSHPDGELSFFNDATMGIAPRVKELKDFSESLGLKVNNRINEINFLEESGYVVLNDTDFKLILDIGCIGPNHQPGHAHADTLSYEFSLLNCRMIVNSGISTYENNERREFERSTASHNTVEVNDTNSSEVWKSFRVGRRAFPGAATISKTKKEISISGSHNGYSYLKSSPIHLRSWKIREASLLIEDEIQGNFINAVSRIYLHPLVSIINISSLILPNKKICKFETKGCDLKIIDTQWSNGFNSFADTKCIEMKFLASKISVEFNW